MRRLYDIANILMTLGLLTKQQAARTGGKNGKLKQKKFSWTGYSIHDIRKYYLTRVQPSLEEKQQKQQQGLQSRPNRQPRQPQIQEHQQLQQLQQLPQEQKQQQQGLLQHQQQHGFESLPPQPVPTTTESRLGPTSKLHSTEMESINCPAQANSVSPAVGHTGTGHVQLSDSDLGYRTTVGREFTPPLFSNHTLHEGVAEAGARAVAGIPVVLAPTVTAEGASTVGESTVEAQRVVAATMADPLKSYTTVQKPVADGKEALTPDSANPVLLVGTNPRLAAPTPLLGFNPSSVSPVPVAGYNPGLASADPDFPAPALGIRLNPDKAAPVPVLGFNPRFAVAVDNISTSNDPLLYYAHPPPPLISSRK